jgi:SNF2 family DNA or RNA helicase
MSPEDTGITPCGHVFHFACIRDSVQATRNCPTCRSNVDPHKISLAAMMMKGAKEDDDERSEFGSKIIAIRDVLLRIRSTSDDQSIIFIQFDKILREMHKSLKKAGIKTYILDGDVNRRKHVLEAFNKTPKSVLILSLEQSPSGMNLVSANHCLLVHPMFTDSPGQAAAWERQAIGRICRQGQTKPCFVYRFVTKGTIEEELARKHHADLMPDAAPEADAPPAADAAALPA